jgi:hypothetical protein
MLLKEHNQTKATHIACLMLLTEYNQTNSKWHLLTITCKLCTNFT